MGTASSGRRDMTMRETLRGLGYSVAVHNDYRQNGGNYTFWLLTHPDGHYVKGEGATDETALQECYAQHQARSTLTDEMVERGAGAMRKVQMSANPYTANYVEEPLAMALAKIERAAAASGKGPLGKAADDEPVFILRANDMIFQRAVRFWIDAAKALGVREDKLDEAEALLNEAVVWQSRRGSKIPD